MGLLAFARIRQRQARPAGEVRDSNESRTSLAWQVMELFE